MTSRPRPPVDRAAEPAATVWAQRADRSESAILSRHLRRLWSVPGSALAVVGWPATRRDRLFASWHYWWQAHVIDCEIDAANREPTPARTRRIAALARGHRVRNITGWTNDYYDDMAWLAISLERAERTQGITEVRGALVTLKKVLAAGWDPRFGALPWRKGSDFYNAPANGPAGIALARLGRIDRATDISDWLDKTLRDPNTGLILDGIHLPSGEIERPTFSYCQGVVLGLETELAVHTGEFRHIDRAQRLLHAVEERMTEGGIVSGGGGGDGGLFNGILARYLAQLALMLPGDEPAQAHARHTAAALVKGSARAAWEHRLEVEGDPLFGHDWAAPARLPAGTAGAGRFTSGGSVTSSRTPERDLSVQISGWMLMEAAYLVTAAGM
ncbi:fructose-bisphosphate aldolase [Nocardia terpenica]|uniref:glycoside hydrolase family 76 protein n=1 Tax=Nocardia terpenica TaxID=455432 RepID=UPI001893325B|nr:glycoside hydrolase family 76 protein [Nocardia terpenica]MBF6062718.1 fructose-bisphosphate aldolase [Nocardia terpenica]MBF6105147.1 fructose-bisphosphate aldolase [Nocardia terpenica]MBF6112416.1 fructose-bisphosphate aldolase [Nocardia terpenica]MBF6118875.1 fructose-bisphosphate aldolase [Nocardia terpenica]MBF6154344.1 fructose-bisphosphate aldolase [Nocardia terpenica]